MIAAAVIAASALASSASSAWRGSSKTILDAVNSTRDPFSVRFEELSLKGKTQDKP